MNRALPPGDRGYRSGTARRQSRCGRVVPGAFRLIVRASRTPERRTPPELNPAARRNIPRWVSGFDRVTALAVLALCGNDVETHLLANRPRQEATRRMRLPAGGFHQFLRRRSARPLQQFQDRGCLAAVAGGIAFLFGLGALSWWGWSSFPTWLSSARRSRPVCQRWPFGGFRLGSYAGAPYRFVRYSRSCFLPWR